MLNLDTLQAYSARTVKVLHGVFLSTEQLKTHGIARSLADDITRMSSNDPDWVPKWSDEEQV